MPEFKPINELTHTEKIDIAIKLKDTNSFFKSYFNFLPYFKTYKECFEYLNEIHLDIFGNEKYSSYNSFQTCMYRDHKNKRTT